MKCKMKVKCRHGPTNTFVLSSPVGELEVISCPHGLHSLDHGGTATDETFAPDLSVTVRNCKQLYPDNGYTYSPLLQTVKWLQNYFSESRSYVKVDMPKLCFQNHTGTFFEKVWKGLASDVRLGETVSYGQLATLCGSPKAQQAVGQAMRRNPFSIIVPCHRVILSSGKVGNYSGGKKNTMKEWLLQYERSKLEERK